MHVQSVQFLQQFVGYFLFLHLGEQVKRQNFSWVLFPQRFPLSTCSSFLPFSFVGRNNSLTWKHYNWLVHKSCLLVTDATNHWFYACDQKSDRTIINLWNALVFLLKYAWSFDDCGTIIRTCFYSSINFSLFCRTRFKIRFFTVLQNTLHLTVGCDDINRLVLIEISFMGDSFVLIITLAVIDPMRLVVAISKHFKWESVSCCVELSTKDSLFLNFFLLSKNALVN